ncbi:BBE domain-containing protein [Streptomyces sp. NBC_00443]|uniref:BBE domain-containing protein n=1 Tax=Streptomyces sp. NBC_00443 TaxID=2975743 RepID=UPI002E1FFEC3
MRRRRCRRPCPRRWLRSAVAADGPVRRPSVRGRGGRRGPPGQGACRGGHPRTLRSAPGLVVGAHGRWGGHVRHRHPLLVPDTRRRRRRPVRSAARSAVERAELLGLLGLAEAGQDVLRPAGPQPRGVGREAQRPGLAVPRPLQRTRAHPPPLGNGPHDRAGGSGLRRRADAGRAPGRDQPGRAGPARAHRPEPGLVGSRPGRLAGRPRPRLPAEGQVGLSAQAFHRPPDRGPAPPPDPDRLRPPRRQREPLHPRRQGQHRGPRRDGDPAPRGEHQDVLRQRLGGPRDDARHIGWLRELYEDLYSDTGGAPAAADGAFINYPDTDLADPARNTGAPWQALYFGDNYRRLQRVKAKWDPRNVFHHALSVRAA